MMMMMMPWIIYWMWVALTKRREKNSYSNEKPQPLITLMNIYWPAPLSLSYRHKPTHLTSGQCYKTFFGGNLDSPNLSNWNSFSDIYTCTKMSKQCCFYSKVYFKTVFAQKIARFSCFSLGGNLGVLWKSFITLAKAKAQTNVHPLNPPSIHRAFLSTFI